MSSENLDEPVEGAPEEQVSVRPVEFSELDEEPHGGGLSLDLVLDLSMPITVELGRTTIAVRDLLQLSTGSVIELNKQAGEPVDLYVRDVRFARGEVVVVDNNFGLRITEIINPQRRIRELSGQGGG